VKRVLAALLLLVAACGDDDAATTTAAVTTTAATTTSAVVTTIAETTTTTTTTAPTTTTTMAPVFAFLPTGLGVVDFGATPEAVIAALTPHFGDPTKDTGWIDEPICPPPLYRLIGFGTELFEFTAIFTTAEYFAPAGTEQFFGYSWEPGSLTMPASASAPNLGAGTTVAQLQALYPGVVIGPHELLDAPAYQFNVDGEGHYDIRGALTGGDAGDIVTEIRGGGSCGE
jgi:hypothetical protein